MFTTLVHGCYTRESPFDVVRHNYRGGESGYCELLEFTDAPEGQCPIVIFQQSGNEWRYFEFKSLEAARRGLGWLMMQGETVGELPDGCIQMVERKANQPWFYPDTD